MTDQGLLERLAAHRTLGAAPREELAWLAERGELERHGPGVQLARTGQSIEALYIVLSGRFAIYVDRGAGPRKVMEWNGGDVTGTLPYSRMTVSPGDTYVDEATEILMIPSRHLPEMIQRCPWITTVMVHQMLDRTRVFTASDLQAEKMMSLGRLAAGLAHELNNPAAAAVRGAQLLSGALADSEEASRALGAAGLGPGQLAAIDSLRTVCQCTPALAVLSPLERADREDLLAEWLSSRGADPAAASALVETSVDVPALDGLAAALPPDVLPVALRWIAAGCATRSLAADLEKAASRMHSLVSSVKRFTHMDRAPAPEPVDLGQSLADVIAMVAAKARHKSVRVSVELEPDLPPVLGLAGELNQVWLNLLDNAIDAAPEGGHVAVRAGRERASVVVRVADDGPGIPPELRSRIFDAFFTTKPVGQGTGLGLEIVRRLVMGQGGEIDFESEPGRTEFRVKLPAAAPA